MLSSSEPYDERAEVFSRLKWAMFFRVVAVTILLGATAGLQLRVGTSPFTVSLVSIYILIGVTYVFTAVSGILLRWVTHLRPFAYLQVCYEVLLITALISVTGRLFSFVYILGVLSASIILQRSGAMVAALLSSGGYAGLLIAVNKFGTALPYLNRDFVEDVQSLGIFEGAFNVSVNVLAFFMVAFLASYLTEKLRRTGMQLAEKEENLEALEAWNENVIRSLPSGLITTDREGKITSFNRAAELITGKGASQVLGTPLDELFPEIDLDNCPPETTFFNAGGEKRHLGLSLSALRSGKGEIIGRILIFQDQTAYREMEEQLKLSDRLAAVGQLAAGLAHEIRNPLASISGSIQLLRRDQRFEEDDRLLRILLRETERLNELITEFLHFARPTSGQVKKVNLKNMLVETVELFRHQGQESGAIRTSVHCPPELDTYLDTKLLRQVLWNLLVNAAEAMPDGGEIKVMVEVLDAGEGFENERQIRITVSDTGRGIPDNIREKIFAPFFTTKEYGTGLGLATVYRSVESMGGRIKFESELGKGTNFIIDLPVKKRETEELSREAVG